MSFGHFNGTPSRWEIAMESAVVEASWEQFYQKIYVEFPHAKVFGLRIRASAVVTCDRLQPTILLTREEARSERTAPAVWNAQWRQLRAICRELRDGILPEVTFRDGSPQTILPDSFALDFTGAAAVDGSPDLGA